jgi:hypothetical protein
MNGLVFNEDKEIEFGENFLHFIELSILFESQNLP